MWTIRIFQRWLWWSDGERVRQGVQEGQKSSICRPKGETVRAYASARPHGCLCGSRGGRTCERDPVALHLQIAVRQAAVGGGDVVAPLYCFLPLLPLAIKIVALRDKFSTYVHRDFRIRFLDFWNASRRSYGCFISSSKYSLTVLERISSSSNKVLCFALAFPLVQDLFDFIFLNIIRQFWSVYAGIFLLSLRR